MNKLERVKEELAKAKKEVAWHKERLEQYEQMVTILEDALSAQELTGVQ